MIFMNFYHKQGQGVKVQAAPPYPNLSWVPHPPHGDLTNAVEPQLDNLQYNNIPSIMINIHLPNKSYFDITGLTIHGNVIYRAQNISGYDNKIMSGHEWSFYMYTSMIDIFTYTGTV